jgi:hypothetical protein
MFSLAFLVSTCTLATKIVKIFTKETFQAVETFIMAHKHSQQAPRHQNEATDVVFSRGSFEPINGDYLKQRVPATSLIMYGSYSHDFICMKATADLADALGLS